MKAIKTTASVPDTASQATPATDDEDDLEAEMKLGLEPPRHPRIVIAGFGNALRGDDGAGWRVAQELATRWGHTQPAVRDGSVCILADHQPLPEWVPALAAANVVYFVDAATGADGLEVRRLAEPAHAAPLAAAPLMDGHTLGVEGLLALAHTLYGHVPEAYLLTLPVERLGFASHLSPRTQAAVDEAVQMLDRVLANRTLQAQGRHADV